MISSMEDLRFQEVPTMDGQPGWRFCDKCFGLFFNGDPDLNRKGRCPVGGQHHAQGFVFYLPHDIPSGGQPDWRFCHKCFGIFFGGDPDPSRRGQCPAGGPHDAFGFNFVLPHDTPSGGQSDWRFCPKCFGMFFGGDPNNRGHCPGGGSHDAFGFTFVLPHRDFPSPSITIQAVAAGGRFIDVSGVGFEPSQTTRIDHEVRFSSGSFQPPSAPRLVASDAAGNVFDRIPMSQDISSAKVSVFDPGSGETAIATIG